MSDNPSNDAPPPQRYEQAAPPPQQPTKGSGLAVAALVLGIIAVVFFWTVLGGILFGLLALILGIVASGRAKRGQARGRGMAIIGAILGVLGLLGSIAVITFLGALFGGEDFSNLRDCLADAGSDQAKIQQCQQDFQSDVQN
ncbi:MAG: DUF4190 domain-containing protein [Nocardioidaceae bacterium]|nr:DUF4190 domain-containing protein [Nocardioidaceae bacterium]NUS51797.1 DUF4190 domain-containing protein [Nocardioidaceae bacterium]